MAKKSILSIAPILPRPSDLKEFARCLEFLEPSYTIKWIDPLESIAQQSFVEFSDTWRKKIYTYIHKHDVFIGFSLGALLLQQSQDDFSIHPKKVLLLSPPSILDHTLKEKLSNIYNIAHGGDITLAIKTLHRYIHPESPDSFQLKNNDSCIDISTRLQFGIQYILQSPPPTINTASKSEYYQLVGVDSKLVTENNLIENKHIITEKVPEAGMRILEDNPVFCQNIINQWLQI